MKLKVNLSVIYQSFQAIKIIDVENTKNLVVQHNNALAYTQVSDQAQNGVIIEGLSEALINHGELVQKYLMTDA